MTETSTSPETTETKEEVKEAPKKCGCGKTKDADGNCDGTHAEKEEETPAVEEKKTEEVEQPKEELVKEDAVEAPKVEEEKVEAPAETETPKEEVAPSSDLSAKKDDAQEKKRDLHDSDVKPKTGDKILIRCISNKAGVEKTKNMFHTVANNKTLMKNSGFVISDPNYDAKMHCINNNLPYPQPK